MADRPTETPEARGWRAAYQAGMRPGSAGCPGDEALAELVLGELGAGEREDLARHVTECRRCADDYRTLRALHAETGHGVPRSQRLRWRPRWGPVAAAAGLVAALGIAFTWMAGAPRRHTTDEAVRAAGLLEEAMLPSDGAVLASPPARFSWPPQAGASGYRVRLRDDSADLIWESGLGGATSVSLPVEVAAGLRRGTAYLWTVELEGDASRRRLGPFWFEVQSAATEE
jgi:hypothetical protein